MYRHLSRIAVAGLWGLAIAMFLHGIYRYIVSQPNGLLQ